VGIKYIVTRTGTSFDQCAAQYDRLVHKIANRRPDYLEEEDTVQVLRVALWRAWRTFRPGKVKFITYATNCLQNALAKLNREAHAGKRFGDIGAVSLEAMAEALDIQGGDGTPAELRALAVYDDADAGLLMYGATEAAQRAAADILQGVPVTAVPLRGLADLRRHLGYNSLR
jgi:RNA polymerase sigma factor (sigma-70 family)